MRVCVVGCGAVGSLFAANLAQLEDVDVWAYDLAREHVDAINANGLRLSGAGEVVGRLRATTDAAELPPCDFGIVATKAMHTEPAIAATAPPANACAVAAIAGAVCIAFVATIPKSHAGRSAATLVARGRPVTSPAPVSRKPSRLIAPTCSSARS